jgi:hypothetical protein
MGKKGSAGLSKISSQHGIRKNLHWQPLKIDGSQKRKEWPVRKATWPRGPKKSCQSSNPENPDADKRGGHDVSNDHFGFVKGALKTPRPLFEKRSRGAVSTGYRRIIAAR